LTRVVGLGLKPDEVSLGHVCSEGRVTIEHNAT
jgi:hypothetical protein